MIDARGITRVHYGYFIGPSGHPDEGQPIPVSGFLIRHPAGTLLFDTGLSPVDDEARQRYQPRIRPVTDALAAAGVDARELVAIANCHLHADHAGGNHAFPGVPIYVQRTELEAAHAPDYTCPPYAYDFPGSRLEVIDGPRELLPDVRLVPTPGHSPGHQSLLLHTNVGVVMLAGQASNTTWEFSTSAFAARLHAGLGETVGRYPAWMTDMPTWDVQRALFAHDLLVWERDQTDIGRPVPG